ncbi:MAG: CCA tRNA nucleotidyltransferase [Ruminococcaceae bacterium]|nr:CCA tRNA nucleotidyltransferase [Oscillospiraceae bacterium]
MQLAISDGARAVLETINSGGYLGYVVGGAVRDLVMGILPHDYDIATSAQPQQIKSLFKKTVDTGIRHGTVTVIESKIGYEVTTFRQESGYSDTRHPDEVVFLNTISEDLARRDFTINAMAYHPEEGLIDLFGGQEDLQNKIIRCVGEPETRFREDALRMLRAVRFAIVLDFEIEPATAAAIRKCALLIKKVSAERIRDEMNKILVSDHPEKIGLLHEVGLMHYILPELEVCFFVPQKNKYHIYNVGEHILHAVAHTPCELVLRWAALLHDIGKPPCKSEDANGIIHFYGHHRESVRMANDILHRLRMDNEAIRDILILVENHDVRIENTPPGVKRMMAKTGAILFDKLLILQEADNRAKNLKYFKDKKAKLEENRRIYQKVLAEHQPYLVSDLAVNGKDLIRIGFKPGRELGDMLKLLLEEVLIRSELNRRDYLLMRAKELRKKR